MPSAIESNQRLLGRRAEQEALDTLVAQARKGTSGVLVLHGQPGIGKTALIDYVVSRAADCRVARATAVESEIELAYGGLHQLCGPFLDRLDRLPGPQQDALGTAFGLSAGRAPDRFLVGLAVLSLLALVAEERPLVCLVDDAQWLDEATAQTVAFVARRLLAEPIALIVTVRDPADETAFAGLPDLAIRELSDADAGVLLDSVLVGPIDARVRGRILAEANGNPLAILELPRAWTAAELADVLAEPEATPVAGRLEQGYVRRLEALPIDARRLLLVAAAEPYGDVTTLWSAAHRLGLGSDAASPAEEAGLIEFGERVRFRHPLVRAVAYRTASTRERQQVHAALAEATSSETHPDRRAWHRALTTHEPDEAIAAELERSAGRARARGGLVAASAMLERAAQLTPEPARRAQRALAAASAKRDSGQLSSAADLLAAADAAPDALRSAEVQRLRGLIAFDERRGTDAARLLLGAARALEGLDEERARETYLDALTAAIWVSGPDARGVLRTTAAAARAASGTRLPPHAADVVLDALAIRLTDGYAAAGPSLTRALSMVLDAEIGVGDMGKSLGLGGATVGAVIATEVWDFAAGRELAERQARIDRNTGALIRLQFALNLLATNDMLSGDVVAAAGHIEEARIAAEAAGNAPITYAAMLLAAIRGQESVASELIVKARATSTGEGRIATFAGYSAAVLHNGLGRHDVARDAARHVFERDVVGGYQVMAIAELGEAASRTGDATLLSAALERASERAQVVGTDWAAGVEARLQALRGDDPDDRFRESTKRLGRAGIRVEVARGHLLHGEWLRRDGRRVDAREELRTAHAMLASIGADAFAERARRELLATGEKVRKRTVDTVDDLTAQEVQIARLARDGFSNPEIGARLFLSPRTVEWHLRKVFAKLEVNSRRQLRDAVLEFGPA